MKLTWYLKHPVILMTTLQIGLVILTLSPVFSQSSESNKQNIVIVENTSQPECPLNITPIGSDTSYEGKLVVNFAVKNLSEKKIRVFIVSHRVSDSSNGGRLEFLSPLAPGQILNGWEAELRTNLKSNSKIYLSIDYILFADGTSWGNISKKEIGWLTGFIEGQEKTLSELRQLAKTDSRGLSKLLEQETFDFDRSRIDKVKSEDWRNGFEMGYRMVLVELKPIYKKLGVEMLPLDPEEFYDTVETIFLAV